MSTIRRFQKKPLAVAIAAANLIAMQTAVVFAEDVGDAGPLMEEIVVTAQYREQSIQEIPYNISAVSGDDLTARHILDQNELLRNVPGVSVVERGARNSGHLNNLIIRGLNLGSSGLGDMSYSSAPSVSTYVGNTPIFANFVLKDIERVEVLRGPQGTLYGSGSLGGTVRYIMNKPNLQETEATFSTYGSSSKNSGGINWGADALLNLPLSDNAGVRLSFGRVDNAGVTDYTRLWQLDANGAPLVDENFDGTPGVSTADIANAPPMFTSKKDADWAEKDYARISLLFEPSENLSVQLTHQYQKDKVGGRTGTTPVPTEGDAFAPFTFDDNEFGAAQLEPADRELNLTTLEIEWDLGFATLTSSTSTYEHEGEGTSDNSGFYSQVGFGVLYGNRARTLNTAQRDFSDETTVQEFRLISNSDGFVDWTVGAYYIDQDYTTSQDSTLPGWRDWAIAAFEDDPTGGFLADGDTWFAFADPAQSTPDGVPDIFSQSLYDYYNAYVGGTLSTSAIGQLFTNFYGFPQIIPTSGNDFHFLQKSKYEETTVYGEATLNFSERFRMTVGLRAFDNKLKTDVEQDIQTYPLGDTDVVVSDKDDGVLGKVNVSWDFNEDHMVYATVSEGYRRGGVNAYPLAGYYSTGPDLITYEADEVLNYEVGFKGWTDNFSYTASVYVIDWDKPQVNSTVNGGIYSILNADEAESKGIELEIEGFLGERLHYNLGYSYTDAELTKPLEFNDGVDPVRTRAASGNRLPGTAEHMFNVSVDYSYPLSNGMESVFRINGYYQSDTFQSIDNKGVDDPTNVAKFGSFSLWDVSYSVIADKWTAALFVKNIGNEAGTSASFEDTFYGTSTARTYGDNNGAINFTQPPRTIGLSLSYRVK